MQGCEDVQMYCRMSRCLTSAARTCALPMSRTSTCQGMTLSEVPSMNPCNM